uniref:Neurofilament medium polypeptide n=2 Tax=Ciona intestinalis TaxID=7719 RepID=F6QEM0_CIOIN
MGKLNPKKMKVAELKVELESRNIEVGKGMKKADLVALLLSSIESDENVSTNDDSMFSEEESQESELNTTSEVADAEPEVTKPEQTVGTDQSGESEPTQESNLAEEQASGHTDEVPPMEVDPPMDPHITETNLTDPEEPPPKEVEMAEDKDEDEAPEGLDQKDVEAEVGGAADPGVKDSNNDENASKNDDVTTNDDVTPDDGTPNDDVTKDDVIANDVTPKDEIADVASSAPEDQTSEEPGMGNGEETPVVPDVA